MRLFVKPRHVHIAFPLLPFLECNIIYVYSSLFCYKPFARAFSGRACILYIDSRFISMYYSFTTFERGMVELLVGISVKLEKVCVQVYRLMEMKHIVIVVKA